MTKPKLIFLNPSQITADPSVQYRKQTDLETAEDYAAAMKAGAKFPAVITYFDGEKHWLSDGFTRHIAAQSAKKKLLTEVREGGRAEAKLNAIFGDNQNHGQRYKREEKRSYILALLTDPEINIDPATGAPWSDSEIARKGRVSRDLVAEIRKAHLPNSASEKVAYTTKHGSVATMQTGNIGGKRAASNAATSSPSQASTSGAAKAAQSATTQQTSSEPDEDEVTAASEDAPWIDLSDERPGDDELVDTALFADGQFVQQERGYVDAEKDEAWIHVPNFTDNKFGGDMTREWPISHFRRIAEDSGSDNESNDSSPRSDSTHSADSSVASSGTSNPSEKEEGELTVEQKIEALPLGKALSLFPHKGHHFRQQAFIYYQFQIITNGAKRKAGALEFSKGPVTDALQAVIDLTDPEHWEGCGGCKGALRSGERMDPCAVCGSVGFVTFPGQGVSADVVAAHARDFTE